MVELKTKQLRDRCIFLARKKISSNFFRDSTRSTPVPEIHLMDSRGQNTVTMLVAVREGGMSGGVLMAERMVIFVLIAGTNRMNLHPDHEPTSLNRPLKMNDKDWRDMIERTIADLTGKREIPSFRQTADFVRWFNGRDRSTAPARASA